MAKITITVADTELSTGTYSVSFEAKGSEIDEGQATAAYFTAFYLSNFMNTPEFTNGVLDYGNALVESVSRDGDLPATMVEATAILTLEDKDVEAGRFSISIEGFGGDETGHSLPTTAQLVGAYARFLLSDYDFCAKVWEFTEEFAKNNGGEITNMENAPATRAA